jgi:hypothetical protein
MSDNENVSNNMLSEFNRDLQILSSHTFAQTPQQIIDKIGDDTVGRRNEIKNTLQDLFLSNVDTFLNDTFNGVMLNNVANSNAYLRRNLQTELDRETQLYSMISSQTHKARVSAMEKEYSIHYIHFKSKMLQLAIALYTIIFVLVALTYMGKFNIVVTAIISVVLLIVYIIVVASMLKYNNRRRIDDWNKISFSKPKSEANKTSCT